MASKKEIKSKKAATKDPKKKTTAPVAVETEEKDEDLEMAAPKSNPKKAVEIDAADILPEVDEKIDDEASVLSLEDEDSEDMPSLDSEDLNPFGDKWEE